MVLPVGTLMRRAAQMYSRETAIISGERQLTFTEAWERACRMANALISHGLNPGDRVGSLEDNILEAQDFFAGAAIANVVRVPLYGRDARSIQVHKLRHTQCKVLVVDSKYMAALEGIEEEIPDLKIIVRDANYESWLKGFPSVDPEVPADVDQYHVIRHTGGTTGQAKAVAYTHRKWLASGRDWTYRLPAINTGDRCLHVSPISHGSGYFYLPMWLQGGCNVLMDNAEPDKMLDTIQKHRINYMFAVPTVMSKLLSFEGIKDCDVSSFKAIFIAGAPISERTALQCNEVFGPVMHQMYGQTEAQPATFMTPAEWFGKYEGSNPLQSAGRPLPFAGLEIRDAEGKLLPVGEEGEIYVRCEGQMEGFWGEPQLTADRIRDGWVRTGDIAMMDKNGFVYIRDRKDDMIISGGFNIWPAEIENAIASHPDVVEVVVFGVPHEKWGETPVAVCVVSASSKLNEADIIAHCAKEIGSYKKPGIVKVRTEPLQKSSVGKMMRRLIREEYWPKGTKAISGA